MTDTNRPLGLLNYFLFPKLPQLLWTGLKTFAVAL